MAGVGIIADVSSLEGPELGAIRMEGKEYAIGFRFSACSNRRTTTTVFTKLTKGVVGHSIERTVTADRFSPSKN